TSFADLTVSSNNILVTTQLLQSAGSAGVNFVGTDADFRAQAQFEAVVEARAGIDEDGGRINSCGEAPRRRLVCRDNRFGVPRAVASDMCDGLLDPLDHLDGNNQVEELRREIRVNGR